MLFLRQSPDVRVGALALPPSSVCLLHAGPEHPEIGCFHQLRAFLRHCVHIWPALCYFAAPQLLRRIAPFRSPRLMNLGPRLFLLVLPGALNNQQVVIPKGFCKPQFSPKTTGVIGSPEVVSSILPEGNKIYQNLLLNL